MTGLAWVLLAGFAVVSALDWVAVARRPQGQLLETVCKPAALGLLVLAALALDPEDGGQRVWFVAGLVLSLAGDVFLLPAVDRFVAGLASFLLAHLAYVAGLAVDPGSSLGGLLVGAVVVAAVGAVLGRRVVSAVARQDRAMVGPVMAYIAAISAMVVAAVATGDPPAIAGAALFYASDALIALTRFERPRPWAPRAIMVTYHLGQLGLVSSLTG